MYDLKNQHLPPAKKQPVLPLVLTDIFIEICHYTRALLELLILGSLALFVAAVLFVALL